MSQSGYGQLLSDRTKPAILRLQDNPSFCLGVEEFKDHALLKVVTCAADDPRQSFWWDTYDFGRLKLKGPDKEWCVDVNNQDDNNRTSKILFCKDTKAQRIANVNADGQIKAINGKQNCLTVHNDLSSEHGQEVWYQKCATYNKNKWIVDHHPQPPEPSLPAITNAPPTAAINPSTTSPYLSQDDSPVLSQDDSPVSNTSQSNNSDNDEGGTEDRKEDVGGGGLSTGAIAGIVVASVAVSVIILIILLFVLFKRSKVRALRRVNR